MIANQPALAGGLHNNLFTILDILHELDKADVSKLLSRKVGQHLDFPILLHMKTCCALAVALQAVN